MNVGEELVAAYLEYIKECEFVQKNLYTSDVQGEIDVVGMNLKTKTIYICEVAIHLTTGMRYINQKTGRRGTVNKLIDKFSKDIEYANKKFADYSKVVMLWSPIVKGSVWSPKNSQLEDLEIVRQEIRDKYEVEIDTIINERFYQCLQEMRKHARKETKEIKNPILRMIQVEEYLMKHIKVK